MGRGEVPPKSAKFFREKMPPYGGKNPPKVFARLPYTAGHILSYTLFETFIFATLSRT